FDCFPVRESPDEASAIIGAVYRDDVGDHSSVASDVMRPLHKVPLVASADSVDRLMRDMHDSGDHHWLVLHEARIAGIVTRSDLGRLPVKLLLFMRLVHLEDLLTTRIRTDAPNDEWLA